MCSQNKRVGGVADLKVGAHGDHKKILFRQTALRAQGQNDSLACTGSDRQPCVHRVRTTALRAHGQTYSLACTRSERQPCVHTVRPTALRAHGQNDSLARTPSSVQGTIF